MVGILCCAVRYTTTLPCGPQDLNLRPNLSLKIYISYECRIN